MGACWPKRGRRGRSTETPAGEALSLTEEEVIRLKELIRVAQEHPYLGIPVILAVTTGMRLGEILGLRWQDVDLKRGRLTVNQAAQVTKDAEGRQVVFFKPPKTESSRRLVDLPEMTVRALKEQLRRQKEWRLSEGPAWQDHGLVCCLQDGRPINTGMLSTAFRKLAARVGLPISFHRLRHYHASLLADAGVPPKVIAERLGHSTVRLTLDTYGHLFEGRQRETARLIDVLLGK